MIPSAILVVAVLGQPTIKPVNVTPSMAADITYQAGSLIVLEADPGEVGPKSEIDVLWNVVDEKLTSKTVFIAIGKVDTEPVVNRHMMLLTGPPGRYAIFANVFVRTEAGNRKVTLAKIWIVIAPRGPPEEKNPTLPPTDPTAERLVVIVYESSIDSLPLAVHRARKEIEKMPRTQFRIVDRDVKTGLGTVPKELVPSLAAATAAGDGVCLVISSGGNVIRTVTLPKTWEKIVEEASR